MATLILSTVGRSVGGPIGAIVGATLGGIVDRALFGAGGRQPARLANLAVQSAAYGEPIPHIVGRMRVAGNLVWATPIRETAGGGKNAPPEQGYRYSASFAVAMSGRAVARVERIWADGKLLRDAAGSWISPVTMRLHPGDEAQAVDPLIAAAEAGEATPAYRGIAYVVFEDLPLADYGNRIPNLTFEVVADADEPLALDRVADRLAARRDQPSLSASGAFPAVDGMAAVAAGSLALALRSILEASGASVGAPLSLRGDETPAATIDANDIGATASAHSAPANRRQRAAAASLPTGLAVGHYDPGRDYQVGLQRVLRDLPGAGVASLDLPMAMSPAAAKTIGAARLSQRVAGRETITVSLPWRYASIVAGDVVQYDGAPWRVRERRIEAMVVALDLQRLPATGAAVSMPASGGRALPVADLPAGPTTLLVLDLPALDAALATPRLWLAAAGAAPGWRSSTIEVSLDDGASYVAGGVGPAATMGTALIVLPPGPANRWDRHARLDVELIADAMWLESRPEAAVLAGANLALVGNELFQFAVAEPIGARRFRLSTLLRGRRGSDAAIAGHGPGEGFVMLDPAALLAFDPPVDAVGRTLRFRPAGRGDAGAAPASAIVGGAALRPLSPAGLMLTADAGDIVARWTRRSRAGFGWPDFTDPPLGEEVERYRVELWLDGRPARRLDTGAPALRYTTADRAADGGGATLLLRVAQLSATVGPGDFAVATLTS